MPLCLQTCNKMTLDSFRDVESQNRQMYQQEANQNLLEALERGAKLRRGKIAEGYLLFMEQYLRSYLATKLLHR